ncbi:MAG TPA: glycoside hydrolase family 43 protein [Cytophagaceae bacterium]|jgi:alpha-N-arabinofuranosidase
MKYKDFQYLYSVAFVMVLTLASCYGQSPTFTNPVIAGAYADPSICRVGDDYYLSNSSFEYFPGIPIWHSKDLIHWEHAGFGIHRKSQFDFNGVASSAGAWAGNIRYNDGVFYLPLSWVDWRMKVGFKTVILTATSPSGPWSDPHVIADTIWGVDPSLFFDDDGKSYIIMNHPPVGFSYPGAASIMLQEINLKTMALVGTRSFIGRGALIDAQYPEGGKMVKKDGYYYLFIAEGGTAQYHAVTVSRSKNITGPYENYQGNPILTHRFLGYTYPIINIGHADIIETQNGEWWMSALGSRVLGGKVNIFGRESFMVPVKWDKGEWPIVSPGHGLVREIEKVPKLNPFEASQIPSRDEFDGSNLSHIWAFIRTPARDFHSLGKGQLRLLLGPEKLSEVTSPAFIGQRLCYRKGEIESQFIFKTDRENEEAGLVIYKSEKSFLKYIVNNRLLKIIQQKDSIETLLFSKEVTYSESIKLKIIQNEEKFDFLFSEKDKSWKAALSNYDGSLFSVEQAGGYMGAFVGIYGSSQGRRSSSSAIFKYFEYKQSTSD